jgi:uncharacterized protein YutE (UPF0331/DUF86 family)
MSRENETINGVILQKLQSLDQVLTELRSLGQVSIQTLHEDWRVRRAVERDLQVLVEIVIDVCQRLISLSNQAPATTGAEAVERCIQLGALSRNEAYEKMVRFRNFIVYRYECVDVEILADMVNRRLEDFEHFRNEILNYVQG